MTTKAARAAEAYRRGLMGPETRARYEEAVRRGVVRDAYAKGRLDTKGAGKVSAAISTLNESIPGLDEAAAALTTGARALRGDGSIPAIWRQERDYQSGQQDAFRQSNPVASNLTTGLGYAIQAVPAFLSGGSTVAPQASNVFARTAGTTARNATTGAGYSAANAFASRGTLEERTGAANASILPGAAAGVIAPAIIAAPGAVRRSAAKVNEVTGVGRATVRAANAATERVRGRGFLDPRQEAVARIGQAMKADGLTPAQIRAAMTEWNRVGGPSPAFMDLVSRNGGGQRTMALIRGSAMTGGGRDAASRYGRQVGADLQDEVIARTQALTPDRRTVPEVETSIAARITDNSQPPPVVPGSGGAQVSARLNQEFDAAKRGVDAAYDAARAAAPDQAIIPKAELPRITSNIREAVRDIAPDDMPSVANKLGALDRLNTVTVRDLFETRQQLSALRQGPPSPQSIAAGRAVQAIDAQIEDVVQRGVVTGDPQVVGLWRQAIAARRDLGQRFQGGDMIEALTERTNRGGGRANVVSQEDASRAILGGGQGLSPRTDMIRDLTRMRDTLGPDSAEWGSLRQEALSRLLAREAGSENYGATLAAFERQNPELASLLIAPADRAAVAAQRAQISGAVADRQSLTAGQGVLNTTADRYAANMGGNADLTRLGATRAIEDAVARPPEGATGVLNRVSTATAPGRNLAATFGDDVAADYRQSVGQMVDQVQNARFINPNTNSQSAGRLMDVALVENLPPMNLSPVQWTRYLIEKIQRGATLTDAERQMIVQIATSKGRAPPELDQVFLPPPPRLPPPDYSGANVFAIPAAYENSR